MPPTFDHFFRTATGNTPYDYQCRLAGAAFSPISNPGFQIAPDLSGACASRLISIPTGLGKTAAVVLAWLWNRVGHPDAAHRETWPRRIVICLPMRALVDQIETAARAWLTALKLDHIGVHILMGGEDRTAMRDWDLNPEHPAILIGTQDMLLSRALNRGYGLSRYRWPMHFGLLNNDALWVFDELQLMGVSVETSAQLNAFRHKLGLARECHSWWMSATLDADRLRTVDHAPIAAGLPTLQLSPEEKQSEPVKRRIASVKKLHLTDKVSLSKTSEKTYEKQLSDHILSVHEAGTFTLVIVNRVPRAREVFRLLQKAIAKQPETTRPQLALVHSRFRPRDRAKHTAVLTDSKISHKIVIATQAVEAGVDVSAKTLITELAPWSSLVQRFGRCNRAGEFIDPVSPATIHWIDIDPSGKEDLALPYETEDLVAARAALASLTEAGPSVLFAISISPRQVIRPVIRRRDLVDLFDTTPDLCGQDLDISRYIRDGDDNDVQFFWRDIKGERPGNDEPAPQREELCRISIGDAAKFLGKKTRAWRWNPLDEQWESAAHARPGGIYLVDAKEAGGYDDALGWTGDPKDKPTPHPPAKGRQESYAGNRLSFPGTWQTIADHTALVVKETDALAALLAGEFQPTLHAAALWHDVGKAHGDFQKMLRGDDSTREDTLWAKSENQEGKCSRTGFRHELASALAWLLAGPPDAPERDLVAYLIAAHHGKVRLSIRSLPNEPAPSGEDRLFARGIWHGETLPSVALDGLTTPAVTLDLSFMKMGEGEHGPSWLARTVALRDRLGPFRLAFLETLLRVADMRASALADSTRSPHLPSHELATNRSALAQSPFAGEATPAVGQHPHPGGAEHGLRERTGGRENPSRETRPEHATRYLETSQGLLSYAALAPLLAERVQAVEVDLSRGAFADFPLGDELVLELHRRIVGDLIPDWAGRWRTVSVTVGRLAPPAPHLVPERMRNYGLDLQARWPEAAATIGDRTLEFLSFAEGRFLTIHPFADFNGRTIRVFLGELLRRLDLPPVRLEAESADARSTYFAALEAADSGDFSPLIGIWRQRLSAETPNA